MVFGHPTQVGVLLERTFSWWKLDETSDITAVDAQGNNNGTLTDFSDPSSAWTTDTAGTTSSGALEFDSTDYVHCGKNSSLNIMGPMTIIAWAKPDNWTYELPSPYRSVLAGKSGYYSLGYESFSDTGEIEFRLDDDTDRVAFDTDFTDGRWHQIAGVYTGTKLLLYLDGTEVASKNYDSGITASPSGVFVIGRQSMPYDGKVDEVRVYDAALSAAEILQNYTDINFKGTVILVQ